MQTKVGKYYPYMKGTDKGMADNIREYKNQETVKREKLFEEWEKANNDLITSTAQKELKLNNGGTCTEAEIDEIFAKMAAVASAGSAAEAQQKKMGFPIASDLDNEKEIIKEAKRDFWEEEFGLKVVK